MLGRRAGQGSGGGRREGPLRRRWGSGLFRGSAGRTLTARMLGLTEKPGYSGSPTRHPRGPGAPPPVHPVILLWLTRPFFPSAVTSAASSPPKPPSPLLLEHLIHRQCLRTPDDSFRISSPRLKGGTGRWSVKTPGGIRGGWDKKGLPQADTGSRRPCNGQWTHTV